MKNVELGEDPAEDSREPDLPVGLRVHSIPHVDSCH